RTLAAVHRALRAALGEAAASEDVQLGLAILSARSRARRVAPPDGFPAAVDALASDAGLEVLDTSPGRRLTAIAVELMRRPDVARDVRHPLHVRLRELVAATAAVDVAGWYAHDRGEPS